jgi:hypothetical protein
MLGSADKPHPDPKPGYARPRRQQKRPDPAGTLDNKEELDLYAIARLRAGCRRRAERGDLCVGRSRSACRGRTSTCWCGREICRGWCFGHGSRPGVLPPPDFPARRLRSGADRVRALGLIGRRKGADASQSSPDAATTSTTPAIRHAPVQRGSTRARTTARPNARPPASMISPCTDIQAPQTATSVF